MNVHFTSTHINTICELNEIAKKHNCKLYISTMSKNNVIDEPLLDIFEFLKDNDSGFTDEIGEEIRNHFSICDAFFSHDYVCFELLEGDKSHSLTYHEYEMGFSFDESLHNIYFNPLSDEAQEWIDNASLEDYFHENFDDTTINGFDGVDTKNIYAYREGIALKIFGDLVCEYLNEPKIERVY